ncbi:hypothetical protein [Williamsia sp. CHRR-6]|uniref:hypothetical protein n=1 Tax=Williamsia sp. CHRR-6 TaxID=2835871 RepID=UPI001BD99D9B|nr:hypothetical protein [Williamsia sp. CHRR-6]MBT0566999.1 hypothetical protein [Williamsia sp. CHRR-6]
MPIALTGAALAVATLAGPGTASALSNRDLIELCNEKTDSCTFHRDGAPRVFLGAEHQVGGTLFNCGPGTSTKTITWTDTVGESNSVGLSVILTTEGGIPGGWLAVFKTETEITYGHRWGSSSTVTRANSVVIGAGEKGWITRRPAMQTVSGTYEMYFGSRVDGSFVHYVPFSMTGPADDQSEVTTARTAKMTAAELSGCRR